MGLRAETLVVIGESQDYKDLRLLLPMAAQRGLKLPDFEEEELEALVEAVELLECKNLECTFNSILPRLTLQRWGIYLV